ncbi:MAG: Mut7-C RNAse domain-containing protein [Thermoplasmatota archaeon]
MTKFLVDRMLGQTTKWMRLLGIDTKYAPEGDDERLLSIAEKENRIIITRDKRLGNHDEVFLVEKAPPSTIIPKILKEYDVNIKPLTRCSVCNAIVEKIDKEDLIGKVPAGVYEQNELFWICKECNKIYWKGSHWDNIMGKIEKMIEKV